MKIFSLLYLIDEIKKLTNIIGNGRCIWITTLQMFFVYLVMYEKVNLNLLLAKFEKVN